MKYLILIIAVYLAAVVDTSLVDTIRIGRVTPDLLAMVAIIWLLTVDGTQAFLAAGLVGLFADLIAPGRPGLGMLGMLLVGYAVFRIRTRISLDRLPAQLATVWAGTTLLALWQTFGHRMLGELTEPLYTLTPRALAVGLYTAAACLPVLMIVNWIREPSRRVGCA